MRLRTKFALLLSGCIVMYFLFTTFILSRFFAGEQKAYLNDFQSSLALFTKRQLEMRMTLLYSQLDALLSEEDPRLDELLDAVAGGEAIEVWEGSRLVGEYPHATKADPPIEGSSSWALVPSPNFAPNEAIRWIGRFSKHTVVLDLRTDWVSDALEASHGAVAQIVLADGSVLLRAGSQAPPLSGKKEFFNNTEFFDHMFQGGMGQIPRTVQFRADNGEWFVGTFVPLATEPRLMVSVTTPWSVIGAVIRRTYEESAWIAGLFLIIAIAIGTAFSSTLTSPLRLLVQQTMEVARGKFDAVVDLGKNRRDEFGVLAKSFNRMITELEKLRKEMKHSERMVALGNFSASMAHEIKNPLANIMANGQVADLKLNAKGQLDAEGLRQALKFIKDESRRATQIIDRLMKFSRREKPPAARLDLGQAVRRWAAILRPSVELAGAELIAEFCDGPVECIADDDQLQEVVANLVQNAVHAVKTSERKRITLSLSLAPNAEVAILKVTDTGHGMPAEVKEHIFEPFFTTKKIGEGTGLGLAVCHGIIGNHRGKIEVTSQVGSGTEFSLLLPVAPPLALAKVA